MRMADRATQAVDELLGELRLPAGTPGDARFLLGCLCELVDDRSAEGGEVPRGSRGDQVPVDDDLLIDPLCAAVDHVVADRPN